jgi:hypothetical protein
MIVNTRNNKFYVRFMVLTTMVMKSPIFWHITPSSLLKVNVYFRGQMFSCLQVSKTSQTSNR